MNSILFLDHNSALPPALALACFNALPQTKFKVTAAAGSPFLASNALKTAAHERNIILPGKIHSLDNLDFINHDVIIIFSDTDRDLCPALPGMPVVVRWKIPELEDYRTASFSWQPSIQKMQGLVFDLLEQGYFEAIAMARKNAERVMDSMHEGIIAHDLNRKIFFFNRAAEKITGCSRHEIIGKDCHDIFLGGICRNHCSFKDTKNTPHLPETPYLVNITDKNQQNKQLEMNVVEMKNSLGSPVGVVASFRDLTREMEFATRLGEVEQYAGIVGNNSKMLGIYQTISELASSKVPVFIEGESGTGKELVAAAIHNKGNRKDKLFVPVNCGALPENLLEAELFGHVKGAFTGAIRDKKGRFELADGGTIFLDEIGDISPAMQVKLLRVLQDGTFQKVGGEETLKVNVRLVSATNKNIRHELETGRFREDLFYRICVAPLKLPALRDRKSDIPLLARYFSKHNQDEERPQNVILAQDTIDTLMTYDWPGNVRELQNAIRYLLFRCKSEVARPQHLPENIVQHHASAIQISPRKPRRKKLNIEMVQQALEQTGNNRLEAAKLLHVGRATLYRFLTKYNIL